MKLRGGGDVSLRKESKGDHPLLGEEGRDSFFLIGRRLRKENALRRIVMDARLREESVLLSAERGEGYLLLEEREALFRKKGNNERNGPNRRESGVEKKEE